MDNNETPESESPEQDTPIPFPNAALPQKSNLLLELERFADALNSLKQSHRIQTADGIQLLGLTLNYNITLRQMGMFNPQPAAEESDDDEG